MTILYADPSTTLLLDLSLEDRAVAVAVRAHRGQVDKAGLAYVRHPLRVGEAAAARMRELLAAGAVPSEPEGARALIVGAYVVGVLHDVVEDCPHWPLERLRAVFPGWICDSVAAMTRVAGEDGEAYYRKVGGLLLSTVGKLADIGDNTAWWRLSELPEATAGRLVAKYVRGEASVRAEYRRQHGGAGV